MSDLSAPVEPVVEAPPAEQAPEPAAIHPSWEKTFEEAGIPDMLRPKLIEKIRADDASVQQQLQAARGTIDPVWQDFLKEATSAGVTPPDLIASYNAAAALKRDPIAFAADLSASIDQLVKEGKLTRPQAAAAQQQVADAAAQQIDDPTALLSPDSEKMAALQKQIEELQGTVTSAAQRQQAEREEAAQAQQAKEYGDRFFAEVDAQFEAHPVLKAANVDTKVAVARLADAMLAADSTNTLTEKSAIEAAIRQLDQVRTMGTAAPAAAGQRQQVPVQGGGAALPVPPAPGKFASEADRTAAMLAEAARVLASE